MQTVAIDGDPNFVAIDAHIDSRLKPKKHKRLARKGSTSWEDGRPKPKDSEVVVKLANFGPDAISFGIRQSLAAKHGLLGKMGCPDVFTVDPSDVPFVGFVVANDPGSFRRIDDVLNLFP